MACIKAVRISVLPIYIPKAAGNFCFFLFFCSLVNLVIKTLLLELSVSLVTE